MAMSTRGEYEGATFDPVPIQEIGQLPLRGSSMERNHHSLWTMTRHPTSHFLLNIWPNSSHNTAHIKERKEGKCLFYFPYHFLLHLSLSLYYKNCDLRTFDASLCNLNRGHDTGSVCGLGGFPLSQGAPLICHIWPTAPSISLTHIHHHISLMYFF